LHLMTMRMKTKSNHASNHQSLVDRHRITKPEFADKRHPATIIHDRHDFLL
jgi:hypothetical protein